MTPQAYRDRSAAIRMYIAVTDMVAVAQEEAATQAAALQTECNDLVSKAYISRAAMPEVTLDGSKLFVFKTTSNFPEYMMVRADVNTILISPGVPAATYDADPFLVWNNFLGIEPAP